MDSRFDSFKRGLKKISSRARLPSGRRGSQERQRNITPPRSTDPDDAFTTPPTRTGGEGGLDDTPEDLPIATPGTPPAVETKANPRYKFPWQKKTGAQSPIQESIVEEPEPIINELDEELLEPGITGIDWDMPLFDGLSTNPADHLIDLATDSMERCPDVRAYFWAVGECVIRREEGNVLVSCIQRPTDPDLLRQYDNNLVQVGRKFLQASRTRKEGYYLSADRDILADNQPGKPWYRLPTIGVVMQLSDRVIEPVESEGTFFDCRTDEWRLGSVYKTNIRVPIIWTELFKQGVAKGTHGWDASVMARYYYPDHPAYRAYCGDYSELQVVQGVLGSFTGPDGILPSEFTLFDQILERDFPHLVGPVTEEEGNAQDVAVSEQKLSRLAKRVGSIGNLLKRF